MWQMHLISSRRVAVIQHWWIAGEFHKPIGMASHSYKPKGCYRCQVDIIGVDTCLEKVCHIEFAPNLALGTISKYVIHTV
jgi:hypothetical protein